MSIVATSFSQTLTIEKKNTKKVNSIVFQC